MYDMLHDIFNWSIQSSYWSTHPHHDNETRCHDASFMLSTFAANLWKKKDFFLKYGGCGLSTGGLNRLKCTVLGFFLHLTIYKRRGRWSYRSRDNSDTSVIPLPPEPGSLLHQESHFDLMWVGSLGRTEQWARVITLCHKSVSSHHTSETRGCRHFS